MYKISFYTSKTKPVVVNELPYIKGIIVEYMLLVCVNRVSGICLQLARVVRYYVEYR